MGVGATPAYSEQVRVQSAQEASAEPELTTVAVNWGLLEWLLQEAFPAAPARKLKINGKKVSALSSRAGWVQLDFGYFDDRIFPPRDGSEARLAILAHEARHSDCTGGLSDEDLAAFRDGHPPLSYACGHRHGVCPEEHPLAGTIACDLHPWGAYAVGYSAAASLMAFCQDCSPYAKEQLRLEALESFSRIVLGEEMLSGKLPPIDLTSEGRTGSRP